MAVVVLRRGTAVDDSMQSRDLSAFAQLTPRARPAMPCSPERHRHYSALMLIKLDPAVLLMTSQMCLGI